MPDNEPDDRSRIALAMLWSTRISMIGLEMVLPAAGGFWLDRHFQTLPVFVVVGAFLGLAAGMYHLVLFARQENTTKL